MVARVKAQHAPKVKARVSAPNATREISLICTATKPKKQRTQMRSTSPKVAKAPGVEAFTLGTAPAPLRTPATTAAQQAIGLIMQAPKIAPTIGGTRVISRITTPGLLNWFRTLRAAAEKMTATRKDATRVSLAEAWMTRRSFLPVKMHGPSGYQYLLQCLSLQVPDALR